MATQPTLVQDCMSANYNGYWIDNDYSYDNGYIILPLADGGYSKIRLHQGMGYRNVKFVAKKQDSPPVLPKSVDIAELGVTKAEILGSTLSVPVPAANPTGTGYDWQVSGNYTYVMTTAADANADGNANFTPGGLPFVTGDQDYSFVKSFLQSGIGGFFGILNGLFGGTIIGNAIIQIYQAQIDAINAAASALNFSSVYRWPYQQLNKKFFSDDLL